MAYQCPNKDTTRTGLLAMFVTKGDLHKAFNVTLNAPPLKIDPAIIEEASEVWHFTGIAYWLEKGSMYVSACNEMSLVLSLEMSSHSCFSMTSLLYGVGYGEERNSYDLDLSDADSMPPPLLP
jgi:hypothetical protein